MIVFIFYKHQTRYKQINYTRHPYKVTVEVSRFSTNLNTIENRHDRLNMINFECTLNDYECKNQRNKMSKELRKEIMERDHYTCQICRKYMSDEVGLHIDHIIPISKGGKSDEVIYKFYVRNVMVENLINKNSKIKKLSYFEISKF